MAASKMSLVSFKVELNQVSVSFRVEFQPGSSNELTVSFKASLVSFHTACV